VQLSDVFAGNSGTFGNKLKGVSEANSFIQAQGEEGGGHGLKKFKEEAIYLDRKHRLESEMQNKGKKGGKFDIVIVPAAGTEPERGKKGECLTVKKNGKGH